MSISQAGVYSLKLYENKGFTFLYDTSGQITLSSISNTGDVLELTSNENFIKYANALPPADNNIVLNDHSIAIEINGLVQSNLDLIEKLQSSIYGWIPVFEFMDNQISLIDAPFFPKTDKFNSQVSHTWFEELKPRIFTTHKLQGVVEVESVQGVVSFNGVDQWIDSATIPDVTGNKIITLDFFVKSAYTINNNFGIIINSNNSDLLLIGLTHYLANIFTISITLTDSSTLSTLWDFNFNSIYLDSDNTLTINKSAGVLNSLTINGDSIILPTPGNSTLFSTMPNQFNIGRIEALPTIFSYFTNPDSVGVWNLNINDVNAYEGRPNGNLNSAWIDKLASNDLAVNGSPLAIDLP